MLVMLKTCHVSMLMSVFNPIPTMLSRVIRISRLQVHGHRLFVESIGGEESPSASVHIALLGQYGFD